VGGNKDLLTSVKLALGISWHFMASLGVRASGNENKAHEGGREDSFLAIPLGLICPVFCVFLFFSFGSAVMSAVHAIPLGQKRIENNRKLYNEL